MKQSFFENREEIEKKLTDYLDGNDYMRDWMRCVEAESTFLTDAQQLKIKFNLKKVPEFIEFIDEKLIRKLYKNEGGIEEYDKDLTKWAKYRKEKLLDFASNEIRNLIYGFRMISRLKNFDLLENCSVGNLKTICDNVAESLFKRHVENEKN